MIETEIDPNPDPNPNHDSDAVAAPAVGEPETKPTSTDIELENQKQILANSKSDAKPVSNYEPIVLAFSCNWCSYTSADLAGVNRIHYPANVHVIRFMCSGRIESDFIMRAFECGADGVIVSGCKLGECHYISGNEKAQKRLDMTGRLLDLLGIGADRLGSVWISAAEGAKFANYMNEFVEKIRTMGPSICKPEPLKLLS